jgi:hypothetical protein
VSLISPTAQRESSSMSIIDILDFANVIKREIEKRKEFLAKEAHICVDTLQQKYNANDYVTSIELEGNKILFYFVLKNYTQNTYKRIHSTVRKLFIQAGYSNVLFKVDNDLPVVILEAKLDKQLFNESGLEDLSSQ